MEIELETKEINQMMELAMKITANPSEEPELFCQQSKELSAYIPDRILTILSDFVKNGSPDFGFLLIRSIPIDHENLPPTPRGNTWKIGETTNLAKIQSIFIHAMGDMIAYEAEGYGRLFQDVVPIPSMAAIQTSLGSNTELEIHTEQAFSNLRPDILSLSCLRGDPSALTYILPLQRIVENMTEKEMELLRQPLWKTGVDVSFKLDGHEFIEGDIRGPLAILNEKNRLVFDQDLMFGITEESDHFIQKIIDIYYHHRSHHNLKSGEIIFIDNNHAVHGRSPFFPKYDGMDRFLVRCFATFDYSKSDSAREGRMIKAIYS